MHKTIKVHGLTVTVSLGTDGKPVVFIDTDGVKDTIHGPDFRVRINDEISYSPEQQKNIKEVKEFVTSLLNTSEENERIDMLVNHGEDIEEKLTLI